MSGEEELMAAMGFASFGRPHLKQKKIDKTRELRHLMPGTELVGKCAQCVETGRHGVVYLLCKKDENMSNAEEEDPKPYASLLEQLEQEKQQFALLDNSQFLKARSATNVFEILGRHRFLNRSAMKLVALDHIFQWTQHRQDFSFADICGGPGGFSEYLLWRTRDVKDVRGYGITLKGARDNCDWRLSTDFHDSFTVCYGQDGTGNLYSIANIRSFCDVVRGQHPSGVDLVVADGGLLEARSQLNQESIMTRLILAEVLTMFGVLRTDGDFVCKTFELATPAMLELCWILHRCFGRFAVVKPVTSRPASSERYLVLRGLRADRPSDLVKILEDELIQSNNSTNYDFRFLENAKLMHEDVAFLHYMTEANKAITRSQIQACRRINEYAANKNKRKTREDTVDPKEYCHCWKLAPIPRHEASQ